MAIKKVGVGQYRSTLLPHAIFESVEEARHFDGNEAMRLRNQEAQAGEDALNGLSQEELRGVVSIFTREHDRQEQANAATESVQGWFRKHPEFANDPNSVSNSHIMFGALTAKGCYPPFEHSDLEETYRELAQRGALELSKEMQAALDTPDSEDVAERYISPLDR